MKNLLLILGILMNASCINHRTQNELFPKVTGYFLGEKAYSIDDWPTENEVIKNLGIGEKSVTKYGYKRHYTNTNGCNGVDFYFESDDKQTIPASKIVCFNVAAGTTNQALKNSFTISTELVAAKYRSKTSSNHTVTYDLFTYEIEQHGSDTNLILKYED